LNAINHILIPGGVAEDYDRCISSSPNGTIYALSWYLDIICPDWELLANPDFSTVMPLPVFRSMGRKTLRQPDYGYHLGVFSTSIPDPETIYRYLKAIPDNYKLRKLCLNKFNIVTKNIARIHNAAELDLISPYQQTKAKFSRIILDRLNLAAENSISYVSHTSVNDLLMFSYRLDKLSKQKLKPTQISTLRLIASNAIRYRSAQLSSAYDRTNSLCAVMLFLIFNGRASILHAAANVEGMETGAIEFIIDHFIRKNSEQNLVLSIDNPGDIYLMETLQHFGSGISEYPCLKQIG
jgi:hypothetical protein